MNGERQRSEGSRAAQNQAAIVSLATILEELDTRMTEFARVLQIVDEREVALGAGMKDSIDLVEVLHARAVAQLHARIDAFETLTVWQRLRWLVRGERPPRPRPTLTFDRLSPTRGRVTVSETQVG